MSRPNGWILYDGPSAIDGAPIVVVATGTARPSANVKTGAMIQVWILARDVSPPAAHGTTPGNGCDGCPLVKACYVDRGKAPRAVWSAFHDGRYPAWEGRPFGRAVRWGAYGDPAAIPIAVVESVAIASPRGRTGYTHRWRDLTGRAGHRWKRLVMASVEDDRSERMARRRGWRTFRVAPEGTDAAPVPGAIRCPADGGAVTCARCRLCDGAPRGRADRRPSIWIPAHGPMAGRMPG